MLVNRLTAASMLVISCTSQQSSGRNPAEQDRCLADSSSSPLVTEDSVGLLPARATLERLLTLCPSATRTAVVGGEAIVPGLEFHLGRSTAVAVQERDTLVAQWPPDEWIVAGPDFRLPLGLSSRSRWAELRAAYGDGVNSGSDAPGVSIQFCRFPRLTFQLQLVSANSEPVVLNAIPDSTLLTAVVVNAQLEVPNPCSIRG